MKKLHINWTDLETAFEQQSDEFSSFDETSSYLDTETGEVVVVDEMVRQAMDSIVEDLQATGLEDSQWTEQQVCSTPSYQELSEWMKPALKSAMELEYGASLDRFKSIPKFDSHESFEWMEGFVATVRDDAMQSKLASSRQREEVIQWLHSIDIEPLNPNELAYDAPPLPELRKIMFAEVRRFVRIARDVPGVQQIALIGSLTTDKEFPKDIDLLVTITEDCYLSELARLGRQLSGHMMAHGAGADVFLADPANQYLGRTCSWKRCEPGIRSSCDAQSCRARQYLHDDFSAIRLSKNVIQNPPVLLWPKVAATSPSTPDIQKLLLDPLSQGTD